MRKNRLALAFALAHSFAFLIALPVAAQSLPATPMASDAPTQIPTTLEGITRSAVYGVTYPQRSHVAELKLDL